MGLRSAQLIKLFKDVSDFHLRENILGQDAVTGSQDVVDYLRRYYKGRVVEEFKVLYLNAQNVILDEETLAQGTVSEAKVYLRAVCEHALLRHAVSVIVAHNHPGGSLRPSSGDLALTRRLREALALLDIILVDHLLITAEGYVSFAAEGML